MNNIEWLEKFIVIVCDINELWRDRFSSILKDLQAHQVSHKVIENLEDQIDKLHIDYLNRRNKSSFEELAIDACVTHYMAIGDYDRDDGSDDAFDVGEMIVNSRIRNDIS